MGRAAYAVRAAFVSTACGVFDAYTTCTAVSGREAGERDPGVGKSSSLLMGALNPSPMVMARMVSALTSSARLWLLYYIGLGLRGRRQNRGREGSVSLRGLRFPEYVLGFGLVSGEQDGGVTAVIRAGFHLRV